MVVETYKVGDGLLTLGVGETAFSQQVRSLSINPSENVEDEDDIEVLSGETVEGEANVTHSFEMSGTVLQDLSSSGFVAYTWDNKGDEVPFLFQPRGGVARAVTGTVRVAPVTIGGDVKARAESQFTWACTGADPVFGALAP